MRDYVKEYAWEQKKYDRISVRIDKKLYEKFAKKLEKDNMTITKWVKNNIVKYVEKN